MRKSSIIVAIAALLLCISLGSDARGKRLIILHTNDTHSHIDPLRGGKVDGHAGVIERAAYIDSVRRVEGKRNVLLLDAGDISQGTSYFPVLHGDLEVELMNAMRYDAFVLGNHEFDNGTDELARRMKDMRCPVLCANYDFSSLELGKYVRPYVIVKRGGFKIGIIGLLTDVKKVVAAEIASQLKYMSPADVTNRYAAMLKEKMGCDLVICLSHLGYWPDTILASKIRNVDIIVGGHSHTNLSEPGYVKDLDGLDVMIVQDGSWGFAVGKIDITHNQ